MAPPIGPSIWKHVDIFLSIPHLYQNTVKWGAVAGRKWGQVNSESGLTSEGLHYFLIFLILMQGQRRTISILKANEKRLGKLIQPGCIASYYVVRSEFQNALFFLHACVCMWKSEVAIRFLPWDCPSFIKVASLTESGVQGLSLNLECTDLTRLVSLPWDDAVSIFQVLGLQKGYYTLLAFVDTGDLKSVYPRSLWLNQWVQFWARCWA